MKATTAAKTGSNPKPVDSQSDEVLREWSESAFYWQKHIGTIRTMFAPLTQALIDEASIVEGHSVLDVAGGSGEPSLTIADRVGPAGSVTCTDAVAEMVNAAKSEAQRRGITNVAFQQCEAGSLPFQNASFDRVVCRLGVMFFPDPLTSLLEMLRVTKTGGAISLAVWGKSELNPFAYLITDVVARHLDEPPVDPNLSGAFRFSEPGNLAGILRKAGAQNIKERVLEFHITAPISPQGFWEVRSETSGTLRGRLAKLSSPQVDLIAQDAQEAVREYFSNDRMNMPAQMIVVTGRKL